MKINGDWIRKGTTQEVFRLLQSAGRHGYAVGGCVRNDLLGQPVSDIDIATDAHPDEVIEAVESAGHKAIPTGWEHGTITVVIKDHPHDVTTFRNDVETDGRHAVVAFAKTMEEDARRRDFTINALYADQSGKIYDPIGGLSDIDAKKVRFIEHPETRIKEDYLRILRFFRFYAWYGDPDEGPDPDGLLACARLAGGLLAIAKERKGHEFLKLLAAPNPAPAVASMSGSGVLTHVLPGANDTMLAPLIDIENGTSPDAIRRLAALGGDYSDDPLRLSKSEARSLATLRDFSASAMCARELGYRFKETQGLDILLLRAALTNQGVTPQAKADLRLGAAAEFPIGSKDLMPAYEGPALGKRLQDLEQEWIESGFEKTRQALLS